MKKEEKEKTKNSKTNEIYKMKTHVSTDHKQMDHEHMNHNKDNHEHMNHSKDNHEHMDHKQMDHEHMNHNKEEHSHHNHHAHMVKDFKKRFFISLIIMVPILALSPMIQTFLNVDLRFPGDSYILLFLATFLFIYGGKPFFVGAVSEIKQKSPAMMMLVALAISVAYIYSTFTVFGLAGSDFFWELSTLIVIMLLGHWLEMKSAMGASKALEALINLMPAEAHLLIDDINTKDVLVKDLKVGDVVLVKPGEKIPVDGIVIKGVSSVNESMVTGESIPSNKSVKMDVIGGSINGDGVLTVKVNKVGEDTFLSQVIKLVQEAQNSKSKTQRLADKAAKWLFYIAIIAGTLTFTYWMLAGYGLAFAMERAVTVIIIACPHALGLAVPLVTSVSTSIAAQKGLLIRNRTAFEEARKIDTVVFDKTGTLTEGKFGVTNIMANSIENKLLLQLALSLEANSEHPIALGIVEEGKKQNLSLLTVEDYQNIPGQGLQGTIEKRVVMVVSPGYMDLHQIDYDKSEYQKLANQGRTIVFVLRDNVYLGFIALSDIIKTTAKEAIIALREMNITSIMLTGDNKIVAKMVGDTVGIDQVIAEVLPHEKQNKIQELINHKKKVAMTGDGINDAPALAIADLGVAIGAGTDVAIETADVILVRSNPLDVVSIVKLSKATHKKMVQNLFLATGYNLIALPLAAGVLSGIGIILSPAVGAVLMSLSAIVVSINAKLLKLK